MPCHAVPAAAAAATRTAVVTVLQDDSLLYKSWRWLGVLFCKAVDQAVQQQRTVAGPDDLWQASRYCFIELCDSSSPNVLAVNVVSQSKMGLMLLRSCTAPHEQHRRPISSVGEQALVPALGSPDRS
jgi:hypothetical protein